MTRTARIAGLVVGAALCLQGAVGLAGALGAGVWDAAERLSIVGRMPWLADYAVFANASLLVAGIAMVTAAARLGDR
ncbi:hypothetical protein LP52_05780 [Streptomonospora alba]|uniref:Uncharacterized protein n=1 Tax=Streptomonospora alba TaxID=183763 RepID=A0A0C2JEG5_9ACTN|nr:hypothetical protein [Streptomonospora alba]KIH99731.1 hypothetical protein LP52_05780 [Streptomonospora alba]